SFEIQHDMTAAQYYFPGSNNQALSCHSSVGAGSAGGTQTQHSFMWALQDPSHQCSPVTYPLAAPPQVMYAQAAAQIPPSGGMGAQSLGPRVIFMRGPKLTPQGVQTVGRGRVVSDDARKSHARFSDTNARNSRIHNARQENQAPINTNDRALQVQREVGFESGPSDRSMEDTATPQQATDSDGEAHHALETRVGTMSSRRQVVGEDEATFLAQLRERWQARQRAVTTVVSSEQGAGRGGAGPVARSDDGDARPGMGVHARAGLHQPLAHQHLSQGRQEGTQPITSTSKAVPMALAGRPVATTAETSCKSNGRRAGRSQDVRPSVREVRHLCYCLHTRDTSVTPRHLCVAAVDL
ncbi:MAG: hypothetical protein ACPIOQ_50270, partial [Promethearchaeia archaeon]